MKEFLRRISQLALSLTTALTFTAKAAPPQLPDVFLDEANPRVLEVMAVQNAVTVDLMGIAGILGTATGTDATGELAVIVYVNAEHANHGQIVRALPKGLHGIRISAELTEPFQAMAGKPGGGGRVVSHTAKQTPPIQLGTSGGWRDDLANGYCCGGTLGSLVSINGARHILSNYHVLEADIVSGGNGRVATAGESVTQPGLIDVGCYADNAQNVATLSGVKSLPEPSNVDAAVAPVIPGMVRQDGAILEIGTLSSQTVAASLKQAVKKSGRTTGLSRSSVSGLNATVSVTYENECAGGVAFTKTFTGQIIINNRGSKFLNSGDSGSLMVEDVATNPRAVGLLFAGSSTLAVANPIDEVLAFIGSQLGGEVTMVGE
ncbi:MAG: hypothetical protein L0Z50_16105 [Verrucomicrobiales bacterium]|nr:hypothetical protein [Verrucomicrobiales bacterium]